MKKQLLFLSALLLAGVTGAFAQSLSLSNFNTTVTGPNTTALSSYVTINNSTANDLLMIVERSFVNEVPGHLDFFCTNVLCYPPGTTITTTPDTILAGSTSSFYGTVLPNGISGTTSIYYRFSKQNNPADSVSVVLNFSFGTAGLADVKAPVISQPSPNPADNFTVFTYNTNNSTSSDRVVIYNMLGSLVKAIDVPGTNGVLVVNTSDMRSGVYLVSYQQNGKLSGTTKLVVSHH